MSKKTSKPNVKVNVDTIHVGPFKPVKYYEAEIEASDKWLRTLGDIGRKVITQDQYINIGINHVITTAVDNKFELDSVKKTKKKK
jgi:hypothetical protein